MGWTTRGQQGKWWTAVRPLGSLRQGSLHEEAAKLPGSACTPSFITEGQGPSQSLRCAPSWRGAGSRLLAQGLFVSGHRPCGWCLTQGLEDQTKGSAELEAVCLRRCRTHHGKLRGSHCPRTRGQASSQAGRFRQTDLKTAIGSLYASCRPPLKWQGTSLPWDR